MFTKMFIISAVSTVIVKLAVDATDAIVVQCTSKKLEQTITLKGTTSWHCKFTPSESSLGDDIPTTLLPPVHRDKGFPLHFIEI